MVWKTNFQAAVTVAATEVKLIQEVGPARGGRGQWCGGPTRTPQQALTRWFW